MSQRSFYSHEILFSKTLMQQIVIYLHKKKLRDVLQGRKGAISIKL